MWPNTIQITQGLQSPSAASGGGEGGSGIYVKRGGLDLVRQINRDFTDCCAIEDIKNVYVHI